MKANIELKIKNKLFDKKEKKFKENLQLENLYLAQEFY